MQKKSFDRDAARRRVILDAARECILKFGYAKSSLEDIAKQAAVSRPLIYRKFESKEEIFGAVLKTFSKHSIGLRNTFSQSRGANGKSLCRFMKFCCLTRGRS